MQPELYRLAQSDNVPNHPTYPALHYRGVFACPGMPNKPDDVIAHFHANGWRGAWINGIYPFHHYHARAHEVLANLADAVTVQLGGPDGPAASVEPGDVVVLPAGTGHCRLGDVGSLVIVGAYPAGQEDWDLKRNNPEDLRQAQVEIPRVGRPISDPVVGSDGPLLQLWRND